MRKRGMSPEKAREIRKAKGIEDTKLQKLRIKKGFSQYDLSDVSGVRLKALQGYEQRVRSIDRASLETLCDLAATLNCGIEDILESDSLIEKYKSCK